MQRRLSSSYRGVVLLLSLAMIAVLYLPIWKIELSAPQYPEGLTLRIHANRIGGDVDVVNGLNHYIGMHTLHTRDFVEFVVLPYIIGGFAVLGLLVAMVNRRVVFYGWVALFVLIAFTSMIDFYRWEYNYGHNLDPEAPIQVPGMAYQPPLLGYKQLLNFGAYSIPDAGGWVFVGVGVVLAVLVVLDLRLRRRSGRVVPGVAVVCILLSLQGCAAGPEPIHYGQDICAFCKMGFTDKRYGGELCTKKGKVYKYDDLHCLREALKAGSPGRGDVAGIYFIDFIGGPWVRAEEAYLLRSAELHTPMGSNTAAFADSVSFRMNQGKFNGQLLKWKDLYR